jgi:hypothetical protein
MNCSPLRNLSQRFVQKLCFFGVCMQGERPFRGKKQVPEVQELSPDGETVSGIGMPDTVLFTLSEGP